MRVGQVFSCRQAQPRGEEHLRPRTRSARASPRSPCTRMTKSSACPHTDELHHRACGAPVLGALPVRSQRVPPALEVPGALDCRAAWGHEVASTSPATQPPNRPRDPKPPKTIQNKPFSTQKPTSEVSQDVGLSVECLVALAVARHLQDTTGMSIKRIIHALQPLQSVEVTIAGHTITAQPQITAEAADIITAVQLPGH